MSDIVKKSPRENFALALAKREQDFEMLLRKTGIDVPRFLQMATATVDRQPDLLRCTPGSLFGALYETASLALSTEPSLGQAAIIPRDMKVTIDGVETTVKKAVFMPMYRGMVNIIKRNTLVRHVDSRIVYANDEFEIDYSSPLNPIKHKPIIKGERGERIGAYARMIDHDGNTLDIQWMTEEELVKLSQRDVSRSKAWKTDPEEMRRKSVLRRLAKHGDMNDPLVARVMHLDDEATIGRDQQLHTRVADLRPNDEILQGEPIGEEIAPEGQSMGEMTQETTRAAADRVAEATREVAAAAAPASEAPAQGAHGEGAPAPVTEEQQDQIRQALAEAIPAYAKKHGKNFNDARMGIRSEILGRFQGGKFYSCDVPTILTWLKAIKEGN